MCGSDGEGNGVEPPPTPSLFFLGDVLNVEAGDTDTSFLHSYRPANAPILFAPCLGFAVLVLVVTVLQFHETYFH